MVEPGQGKFFQDCADLGGIQHRILFIGEIFIGVVAMPAAQVALAGYVPEDGPFLHNSRTLNKKRESVFKSLSLDTSGYGRIVDTSGPIPQITRRCYNHRIADKACHGKGPWAYVFLGPRSSNLYAHSRITVHIRAIQCNFNAIF